MTPAAQNLHDIARTFAGVEPPPITLGVYPSMTMAEYLALPAVSAGLLRSTVTRCPRAAWFDSWLNTKRPADDTDASDAGSIAHAILLEGNAELCCVIDPNDHPAKTTGAIPDGWKNKSIREARDAARAAGHIPILLADMASISAMVDETMAYIGAIEDEAVRRAFDPDGGASEVTLVWKEGDTLCKARPDRLSADHRVIVDYKSTAMSVAPSTGGRFIVGNGYDITSAWYRRGVESLTGIAPTYYFLCQETAPPYLCSLLGTDPATLALGEAKALAGLKLWQACVAADRWPGYAARAVFPEPPDYEIYRWEQREADSTMHGIPYEYAKLFERKVAA